MLASLEATAEDELEEEFDEREGGKDCLTCCSMNAGRASLFVPSFIALFGLFADEAAAEEEDDDEEDGLAKPDDE